MLKSLVPAQFHYVDFVRICRGSYKYNESNLKDALSLQSEMKADMGGTEIFEPFSHIFSKDVIKGHPRQVSENLQSLYIQWI